MNKQAILNTAVCYWSDEDDCYVVESPLLEISVGVGDTQKDAIANFENHIATAYESYLEGRMKHIYDRPGRPSKGRVAFNAEIKPQTRKQMKKLAAELGCTQGELIDYLLFFHQKQIDKGVSGRKESDVYEALKSMSDDIQKIVQRRLDRNKIARSSKLSKKRDCDRLSMKRA